MKNLISFILLAFMCISVSDVSHIIRMYCYRFEQSANENKNMNIYTHTHVNTYNCMYFNEISKDLCLDILL